MALSPNELERYSRHILLKEVGGPGQAKLKAARVLVIGAGGLGTPVLMYLAAAGVGRLGVVDDDRVSLSNLQRQVIHTTDRVGLAKTESAAATIRAINPNVEVDCHQLRLSGANAMDIIKHYDLVVDGSDNFATRYLAGDACFLSGKTLITGAVGQFDGQVSTFKPHERRLDGTPYPTYRCLFPEEPPPGLLPSCEEAGILGALTGIIGSVQAIEALKEILDIGDSLAGKLFMYDALAARTYVSEIKWDPKNPLNGERPTIGDLSHHR
jgi:molybdopterin/thiamine biosynthesis adenylyltransferase